jgi:DNA-binding XRE family transcriptional regulator
MLARLESGVMACRLLSQSLGLKISQFGIFINGTLPCRMVKSLHSHHYLIFRKLLTQARESTGMTQAHLANQLGKPQSYVSKYESGDRRLDFTEFVQIADVLSLDISLFVQDYRAKTAVFDSPL